MSNWTKYTAETEALQPQHSNENEIGNLQVNLARPALVSGNLSSVLPFFKCTSGCSLASLVVRCEFATRATLFVLTALVRISSFSIALAGSSLATTAADSVGAVEPATEGAFEPATEGAFEEGAVGGRLGLAMFGALPVPWTGGMLDGNASRNI
jgi:hypothetical protein